MRQESANELNTYIGYVYISTCKVSNKSYIGETLRTLEKRKSEHLRHSCSEKSPYYNSHFYCAIRKYGWENFTWEILETICKTTKEELKECLLLSEKNYISKYNSFKNGYNLCEGGKGSVGRIITDKERLAISLRMRGKKMSKESIEKLRQSHLGKVLSEEHKLKIKEATIKALDKNTIIGKNRCNVRKEKHEIKIKVFTEDGKLVNTFNSINEGAAYYNVDPSYVVKICKRKFQTTGKIGNLRLIWRYENDDFTEEDMRNMIPVIIEVFDINDNFIKEFDCAKDICDFYKIGSASVSRTVSGKQNYCVLKNKTKLKMKFKVFEK